MLFRIKGALSLLMETAEERFDCICRLPLARIIAANSALTQHFCWGYILAISDLVRWEKLSTSFLSNHTRLVYYLKHNHLSPQYI